MNDYNIAGTPNGTSAADFWGDSYRKGGHMLGDGPSKTALTLMEALRTARKEVSDVGCGYGRNTIALVQQGFHVLAVDKSPIALQMAHASYKDLRRKVSLRGCAEFFENDITTLRLAHKVDALTSHRTVHLLKGADQFIEFAYRASELLSNGGFIAVGARSPNDFDPAKMRWLKGREGETAEYSGRPGHTITFVNEELLREAFRPTFRNCKCLEDSEPERLSNNQKTYLTLMLAQKRNDTVQADLHIS